MIDSILHNLVLKRFSATLALALLWSLAGQAHAGLVVAGSEEGQWRDALAPLEIRYRQDSPGVSRGRLRFFVDEMEITLLLQRVAPGVYRYPGASWPLPAGLHDLKLYRQNGREWELLDETELRILSSGGFEEASWTPRADVSATGRDERNDSTDVGNETLQQRQLALESGLETVHRRGDWQIDSNWQWVGSSSPEQSLRYDELEQDAPRLDLSEYRIDLRRRAWAAAIGHQQRGGNPLLIDQFSNRGVGLAWNSRQGAALELAVQAARPLVGWSNPLGLSDANKDRILSLGLSQPLPDLAGIPVVLRLDLLSARRVADPGFDEAAVTDLARSRGAGIGLRIGDESQRWSLRIDYARSRHENPPEDFEQDFVEQPTTLVSKDEARSIGLRYRLLDDLSGESGDSSLDLLLDWRRIDPFYQSIAAEITPNEDRKALGLEGRWRRLAWQAELARSEDNLDELPNVLKTLTREQRISASLDLTGENGEGGWLPSRLNLEWSRQHQFGDNLPVGFDPDSHIPDQVDEQQGLDLEWSMSASSLQLRLAHSTQDNRQPGRDQADFENREIGLSMNAAIRENLSLQLAWAQVKAEELEQALERRSREWLLGLDGSFNEHWSATLNWSLTREDDSSDQNERKNRGLQLQLSWRTELPGNIGKLPLQTFLRYTRNDDESVDRLFDLASDQQTRAWDIGLSLSFF